MNPLCCYVDRTEKRESTDADYELLEKASNDQKAAHTKAIREIDSKAARNWSRPGHRHAISMGYMRNARLQMARNTEPGRVWWRLQWNRSKIWAENARK